MKKLSSWVDEKFIEDGFKKTPKRSNSDHKQEILSDLGKLKEEKQRAREEAIRELKKNNPNFKPKKRKNKILENQKKNGTVEVIQIDWMTYNKKFNK